MNYWVITDTHFGHDKIKEYCGRPDNFEKKIFRQISHKVLKDDVLIHLGDFCVYRDEYWHNKFTKGWDTCLGKKWLIRGNHDRKSASWYLSHGWDFVADSMLITMFGLKIALSHKPITGCDDFDINVHGHHHNTRHHPEDEVSDKHKLVYIEHDYTPLNLRKIVER